MAIKCINIFQSNLRTSKIYPNWEYWFEKKPSGNPGANVIQESNKIIINNFFEKFATLTPVHKK
jgi:hypothetical protein